MSIADKIRELTSARNACRTALAGKGISNASSHGFSQFANDINSIESANVESAKNVTLSMASGNQTISPGTGYDAMRSVTVLKPTSLTPDNIKKGTIIAGVTGTYEGSGGGSGGLPAHFFVVNRHHFDFVGTITYRFKYGSSDYSKTVDLSTLQEGTNIIDVSNLPQNATQISTPTITNALCLEFPEDVVATQIETYVVSDYYESIGFGSNLRSHIDYSEYGYLNKTGSYNTWVGSTSRNGDKWSNVGQSNTSCYFDPKKQFIGMIVNVYGEYYD